MQLILEAFGFQVGVGCGIVRMKPEPQEPTIIADPDCECAECKPRNPVGFA